MSFTEMDFMQFHRIVHAHTLSRTNYSYELDSRDCGGYGQITKYSGVMEIGVAEKNPFIFEFQDRRCTMMVGEGDIYFIPPNHRIHITTQDPGEHTHSSVEFLIDCVCHPLEKETLDTDDCRRIRGRSLILPYVLPASRENDELIAIIRQLVRDRMFMTEKSYFEESQALMQILSVVSLLMRRKAAPFSISPSHWRYCQQAKEYISQHIDRHVSLEEISSYVGINKNYLTNVFSACERTRISEYINRVKLNYMLELITKYDESLRQASEAVGFSDANYVSRIFKKYYGITMREYLRLREK